jgi:hypothetical protein
MIQRITAAALAPEARIAARSMTTPPEGCLRDSRATSAAVGSLRPSVSLGSTGS